MKNERLPILLENQARSIMETMLTKCGLYTTPSCKLFLCPYGVDEIDSETRIISDNALIDGDVDVAIPQFSNHEAFAVIFLLFKEYGLIPMFPSSTSSASCNLPTDGTIGDVCRALPTSSEKPDFAIVAGSMIQNSGGVLKGLFIHEIEGPKIFEEKLTNPKLIIDVFINYLYDVMDRHPCPEMKIKDLGNLPKTITFMQDVIKKIVPCAH